MAVIDPFEFDVNVVDKIRRVEHYGKNIGENWPVVYVLNNETEAYVGETHHASVRMSQHLQNEDRRRLTEIRLITGDDFNKSVILDLEAFLIKHMGSDGKYKLQNGNHGLQDHDYYQREEYEETFRKIWNKLKTHGIVDHSIEWIENSNFYKYSPYKSLGSDQLQAEAAILAALAEDGGHGNGKTIIVRGGAGTGKTILAIYLMKLFADINSNGVLANEVTDYLEEDAESIYAAESISGINKIAIVMPQATLNESVKDVFNSIQGLNKDMVLSTSEIVDDYLSTGEKFDLVIVDEAHRLKCRWHGHLSSYPKFDRCTQALGMEVNEGSELDWIMRCSRNQIFFRDELQTVRPCDLYGNEFKDIIANYKSDSESVVDIALSSQWRCEGGDRYINYVRNILSGVDQPKENFANYDFKLYDDVNQMVEDIKAKDAEYGLCRNAAGYAWKWISKGHRNQDKYDIVIHGNKYRWNSTYKNWINTENSVNEIGCIHTLQGYDLNYVGVIIGNDIIYNPVTGQIEADKNNYHDQQGKSGVADNIEELTRYIKNIYLTLMTRGIKGTYVYVCEDKLREYMKKFF